MLQSAQRTINNDIKKLNDLFPDEGEDFLDSLILCGEKNNKKVEAKTSIINEDQENLDVPLAHGMFDCNKHRNTVII